MLSLQQLEPAGAVDEAQVEGMPPGLPPSLQGLTHSAVQHTAHTVQQVVGLTQLQSLHLAKAPDGGIPQDAAPQH